MSNTYINPEEKLKAAYALNLCTVSVSQIVDYNDLWILEQEYEAILNNLNIENMPKDEALLDILKQLLNVITYFRIQEGDKAMLEQEYRHNIKNAIWSAVPSLNVIVAGDPLSIALSVASQVGTGYMNYRKTKASILLSKEKNEWHLQRSAMEQFNGLRRELFETAWRLADTYQFPDEYRLTERQITQYNQVLLDGDPLRRYERLLYIAPNFKAYPPFHYYLGHAASEISRAFDNTDLQISYQEKAMEHFKQLLDLTSQNILREDQILAACALEYFELRLQGKEQITDSEKAELSVLLQRASKSAGNANDVLQLCAMAYLRINDWDNATNLMRMLVNEGYNQIVNAQFLSAYYVEEYIKTSSIAMYNEYQTLASRVSPSYLCTMPDTPLPETDDEKAALSQGIAENFLQAQKDTLLQKQYSVIGTLADQYTVNYNKVLYKSMLPQDAADICFTDTTIGINTQKSALYGMGHEVFNKENGGFVGAKLLSVLNDCCGDLCQLPFADEFYCKKIHDGFLRNLNEENSAMLQLFSEGISSDNFQRLSFDHLAYGQFYLISSSAFTSAKYLKTMADIAVQESALAQFCSERKIQAPEISTQTNIKTKAPERFYITLDSLGSEAEKQLRHLKMYDEMCKAIPDLSTLIKEKAKNVELYKFDDSKFEDFFDRHRNDLMAYKNTTIFVVRNTRSPNNDWLITSDGIYPYCHPSKAKALQSSIAPTLISPTLGMTKLAVTAWSKIVGDVIPYIDILTSQQISLSNGTPLALNNLDVDIPSMKALLNELKKIHTTYFPNANTSKTNPSLSSKLGRVQQTFSK